MYEKGSQRQEGDGLLVSSQERRALAAKVTNRLSTARRPVINLSNPNPGHTTGGSGRGGGVAGRGNAGRDADREDAPEGFQGGGFNQTRNPFKGGLGT